MAVARNIEADETDKKESRSIPTESDLLSYAKSYIGTYMDIVEKEKPDQLPPLAKNAPYDIEIALLPNGCFCLLFQKSNKESYNVTDRNWEYVEGKVASGLDHIVSVYAHEEFGAEDARERGKKDAITDIRGMESNEIVQASLHLESIVDELTNVAMANRASLKSIATQISKLSPIKDSAKKGFPQSDMMRMVQGMKDYPAAPIEITLDIPDRDLLEKLSDQMIDVSGFIARIDEQEELIEDLEEKIKKSYDELASKIEQKMDHGMALLQTTTDRKIDKGLASVQDAAKSGGISDAIVGDLQRQINELRATVAAIDAKGAQASMPSRIQEALTASLTENRERMRDLQMRVEVIEDYLMKISSAMRKRS